jgi:hypothetical protein
MREQATGRAIVSYARAEVGRKIVPYFVPILFQNESQRLAMGSNSRTRAIASKHTGFDSVGQRLTTPHCLSLEAFLAIVNRRVPGSSPGRGANPFRQDLQFGC